MQILLELEHQIPFGGLTGVRAGEEREGGWEDKGGRKGKERSKNRAVESD